VNLWYTGRGEQGQLAAHEFGHMVGNPDEYRLVATPEEIPAGAGFSAEEAQSVTYGGITGETPGTATAGAPGTTVANSIMGDESGPAQPRHAWPVLDYYNGHLRPAGEAPFHLE
jgi:hypothetical protein